MITNPRRVGLLVRLGHHRWTAPTLVELVASGGCRFVELQHRLGVNPASLRAALEALFRLQLARRNPGYGHPLRPEYLPTEAGMRVAPALRRLLETLRSLDLEEMMLRKWSLPLVEALSGKTRRFGEIQDALPGLTPRALSRALKDLAGVGLLEREVRDEYPPVPVYRLTATGARVARATRAVVQRAPSTAP